MKRNRRQSTIINNFFTLASIIMITITLVVYLKYMQDDEANFDSKAVYSKKEKVIPLECEDETSKSKLFNQKLLNNSLKALKNGYYKLDGGHIKSLTSKSIIEEFMPLVEVNEYFTKAIKVESKKDISKFLTINYEIIEQDKDKKINLKKENKFKAGTVKTSFRANSIEIFTFSKDFKFYDKNEIQSIIDCTIKVYKNNAKKY
ncbi:hypothetical protein [Poseidonibacter ostreae]|jgi:hypothetical protein|uniref:Uncharacterized protein n=1 Tax=Poseidonibacter ostreae TaxID=2654171 RepID=A0A6L4WNN9_9BACT|nr:hypothetical protein [Poseidonibacter ostreae]KAB7883153.1 hypothetical protein GA417_12835 [Poseidonibacter ostreae]KAB7885148.1 hypothetical protein GBG19_14710 [Poseidonibacter ostreae]KAB7887624.1 hypothetical protein GBG18_13835 [Poseidonibacter ostreae]MAC84296.1 hypothetical protein [Arcobacter sp.]|tara:strand:+ start:1249 stop:1857 length:609 start_codon:yes stop_codon:yes gene_type:complete